MEKNLVARATVAIDESRERVWAALVDPEALRQYMFGANVRSDWCVGSPIVWQGEWKGKPYEDKGTVLESRPGRRLRYSHFSPLAGLPDLPENYHTVTIELSGDGDRTELALEQDNNRTEEARAHSERNWTIMLDGLKRYLES